MSLRTAAMAIALIGATSASGATAIDIRDCPLDTVAFVDPWAGGRFEVKRVGADYEWDCADGHEPPSEACRGPFGDLVLEGDYYQYEAGAPEPRTAVWTVIAGTPCCKWTVEDVPSPVTGNAGFKWLSPHDVPKLRDMPFLSIEAGEDGSDFGNPFYAAACTLR